MSKVLKKVEFVPKPYTIKIPKKPQQIPKPEPREDQQNEVMLKAQEQILQRAQQQARTLLAEAQQRSETVLAEAREEGYQLGYAQGKEEGEAQGRAEGLASAKPIILRAKEVLATAVGAQAEVSGHLELQLAQLAMALAKKVVGELAREKEELILYTAKRALKKVRGESQVTIRVNWQDLELMKAEREELLAHTDGIREIIIREDPRVEQGGCLIETNFGAIDARLKTQLAELEKLTEEGKDTGRT